MIEIDEKIARTILQMEEVCYSEGIGPDSTGLLDLIFKEFPNLVQEFNWIYEANVQTHNK